MAKICATSMVQSSDPAAFKTTQRVNIRMQKTIVDIPVSIAATTYTLFEIWKSAIRWRS